MTENCVNDEKSDQCSLVFKDIADPTCQFVGLTIGKIFICLAWPCIEACAHRTFVSAFAMGPSDQSLHRLHEAVLNHCLHKRPVRPSTSLTVIWGWCQSLRLLLYHAAF